MTTFKCNVGHGNEACNSKELFCKQWSTGSVISDLPNDIFPNKVGSINDWDENNILKGLNPDYHAITGKETTVDECRLILSSEENGGIYSWFNLIKLAQAQVQDSRMLLKYIASNTLWIQMEGVLEQQDSKLLFNGFNSTIVNQKKKLEVNMGGAPWLDNLVKLVKTNNKAEIKDNELLDTPQYDTINTGIYDSDSTRSISRIWGETNSSSKYIVYEGTKINDEGEEVEVDIF